VGGEGVTGRNREAGCYPKGRDHVVEERVIERFLETQRSSDKIYFCNPVLGQEMVGAFLAVT
jgi:hypothetical protein